jgi:uncharacterized membrane protein YbhN (UPF0104 family)
MNQPEEKDHIDIKKRFFRLNTFIALTVSAIIIYIFITRFDLTGAAYIIKSSNLLLLICGLVIFYIFLPLRGYRWKELLSTAKIDLPTLELTRFYLLAWFVNSILPARIGDIYRAYLLKKNRTISFSLSLGVIFSERIFDLATTAILVISGGLFYLDQVTAPDLHGPLIKGLIIIGIIVLLFVLFSWRAGWVQRFLPRKLQAYYESFTKGLFRSPARLPIITVESLIIWLSEAGRLYFVAWALGVRIDFMMAVFISQAALIIMSLPITPAGLGLVELLMFTILIPAGFTKETAAAVVIADRLISYWSLIIFGGLHYLFSPRYR